MDPAFLSNNGRGVALACTDSSGSTIVPLLGTGDALIMSNTGDKIAYLAIGDTGFTAVAPGAGVSSYPVFPGTKEDQIVLAKELSYFSHPKVAAVCAAGETTTLIVHLVQR